MRAQNRREKLLDFLLNRPVKCRGCDHPGCNQTGEYRAPKSRDQLNAYYWFCLDHVRAYNEQWDYLEGLASDEIEKYIRNAAVWERPTWPMGSSAKKFCEEKEESPRPKTRPAAVGELEALAELDLEPPVDFACIKTQYKKLVKCHHPDANGGSREAEEKFKAINHAFVVLRRIYEEEE